jgi:two-component system chemotaxis sensor kinase CheA
MVSEKYKDLYLSTTREQLKKLSSLFLALETNPHNQNLIENIFRLLHSLKGAAATMGYKKTLALFHAMEDIIDAAYSQNLFIDKRILDLFFNNFEVLEDNLETIARENKEMDLEKNVRDFKAVLRKNKSRKITEEFVVPKRKHILGSLPNIGEISVATDKLDIIQNFLDDLFISVIEAKREVEKMGDAKLLSLCMETDRLMVDLRRELEKIRIVPLAQIFSALPYLVREIARDEGKKVELIIKDNNLSLDRAILDELVEIVIQLLKNAVAHGISREQTNGQIIVEVSLLAGKMRLMVKDNGQGIDWQKILKLALKNKIIKLATSRHLAERQIKDLIFQAGISRGQTATIISGRGMGLSLVKNRVEELGGTVEVNSEPGQGAIFTIDLPLPLSIFRTLRFQLADFNFGIPLSYVDKIVKMEEWRDLTNLKVFQQGKVDYHIVFLSKIIALPKGPVDSKYIALLNGQTKKIALPIYSNIKQSEVIMKKTPEIIRRKKYLKGVAVSASGRPVLILDINNLI